jgi:proteic killer suppression protein
MIVSYRDKRTRTFAEGGRKGQYSIRINSQWRICFEWPKEARGPTNVEIVDYH